MRDSRKLALALALMALLSLPAIARAQFDEGRAGSEGPGFKAGRLVLHPGLELQGGYVNNIFLQENGLQEDTFILRLSGYLDVATKPPVRQSEGDAAKADPQKIQFRGGVGARYYHFFNDRVPDGVAADAHVDFKYNPSKVFTLALNDMFVRTVQPFTNPTSLQGTSDSSGRNTNTGKLALIGRSKSRVLEGSVGYTNVFRFYDAAIFQFANYLDHQVPAQLSWSFFPRSALVYVADYGRRNWADQNNNDVTVLLSDSNRISNMVGYNGALTERFALTAMLGYAAGFFDVGSDFDGVIATVEARYSPRPTITFTAGYEKDFQPSLIGNFTQINLLRTDTTFILAGAFSLGLRTWLSFNKSGLALAPDGSLLGNQPYRKDTRLWVAVNGEYRIRAWLALTAQVGYVADFTDYQYLGAPPLPEPRAQFQRWNAWLGLRVFY